MKGMNFGFDESSNKLSFVFYTAKKGKSWIGAKNEKWFSEQIWLTPSQCKYGFVVWDFVVRWKIIEISKYS